MAEEQQQENRARRREDGGEGDQRNVRPRRNNVAQRTEPFLGLVDLEIENVQLIRGPLAPGGGQLPDRFDFIALQDLIRNGAQPNTAMVAKILSITSSPSTQIQQRGFNGARGQVTTARHARKIVLICPLSDTGSNTLMIFEGNGFCPRLLANLETRDNGEIRPGSTVLLINPPSSDRTLADGTTPILEPTRPLMVVNGNFQFAERPVVMEGMSLNGFILRGCRIHLRSISFVDTPCGGDLCDQQSIVNGGVVSRRCACVQMRLRVGVVVVILHIEIVLPDGTSFTTQLSSKWFNRQFIFDAALPAGTRAAHLEDFAVEERIFNAANGVLALINSSGGFMVFGWTKRGEVQDQAVDQPGNGLPHNAPRVMVEAGTLNYHVTRIDPMQPDAINLETLNGLKVNVATDLVP